MAYDYDRSKTAAGKFDPAVVKQMKKLTDSNHHDEAYIAGAKMLGATQLAKKFELVAELAKLEGHLPGDLSKYRYSLYEQLKKHAEQTLAPEEFKQFYGAT